MVPALANVTEGLLSFAGIELHSETDRQQIAKAMVSFLDLRDVTSTKQVMHDFC